MQRAPGVWYLAVFCASVLLLSIIAWDGLRDRSREHVLATEPSPAIRGTGSSDSPRSQIAQPAAEPSVPPDARMAAVGTKAMQQAAPTPPALVALPPPAVAVPAPEVQPPIASWAFATVTTTFTKLGRLSVAVPSNRGRRSQNCLALWDRETHMTKEEWQAACKRAPRNP